MRPLPPPPAAALPAAALLAATLLAACGSNAPPPLTGNLTDARGAHAGSFRGAGDGSGDYGNAGTRVEVAGTNTQGDAR